MTNSMEQSNNIIKQVITDIVKRAPSKWEKVEFKILFGKGSVEYKAEALLAGEMKSFPVFGVTPKVRELVTLNSTEKGTLTGISGTVNSDGNFKLKYSY
jgi:hypothetical protein